MRLSLKTISTLSAVAALTAVSFVPTALAQQVSMLPLAEGDFAATELVAPLGLKAISVPTEAVSMSWALPAEKAIDLDVQPFVATSKEYWIDLTAEDMKAGVALFAHAPGALVRINPTPGDKALANVALDPLSFTLITPDKRAFTDGSAMQQIATAAQLKAAGSPFTEGTVAFRLRSDLGSGHFTLKAADLQPGRYVMHVLDAESPVQLAVKTLRSDYLHGDTLTVETSFQAEGLKVAVESVDGYVVSPAGRSWPVRFEATPSGTHKATLTLDALEAPARGLWEAHVAVQGKAQDLPLRRYNKVAFNVALPSASFNGQAEKVARVDGAVATRLGISTITAGRYEVRGVLYGTSVEGILEPIAVAHSANWLEAGRQDLVLSFDAELVKASDLRAPFEVRDLRLVDQGTMGLLHRQARGLSLP